MIQHLFELRRLTLQTLLGYFLLFCLCYYYSNALFDALFHPLLQSLISHEGLIATQITASVFTPIKLAANTALLLTLPLALGQIWRFISPGLYKRERRLLAGALCFGLFLFIAGLLFCFYLVLPFLFQCLTQSLPKAVRFMPDIAYSLDFITWMLLVFACSFELPLVCLVLVYMQWVDLARLKKARPYAIVFAFIIGMLLTPPDVVSQIMLALPLCLLYESGIYLSNLFLKGSS